MKEGDDLDLNFKPLFKNRKERYVVWPGGYVLDRNLFRWYMLFVGVLTVIMVAPAVFTGEYYQAYVACPEDAIGGVCSNPLYGECALPACQAETLYAGQTIGERPKPLDGIIFIMLVPLLIITLFNHFNQKSERYENVRNKNRQHHRKR